MDFRIPEIQMRILSRTLISAMERFYSNPTNVKHFEAWKKSDEGIAYLERSAKKNP
jgi:hypothetical protein